MTNQLDRIALLRVDPDIGRFLTDDERRLAATISVPVATLQPGDVDLATRLGDPRAFGAIVMDGLLFSHPRIGDQIALRLFGPGDALAVPGAARSMLLSPAKLVAAAPTSLAVLGSDVQLMARRWPRVIAGLHVRQAEQTERLAVQLAICQLPRVDQRLLSVMWLLAESWGHVTPVGTRLPLSLTHDALGALIGARRSTVTLALGDLTERGAIVRQGHGWLLLEPPVEGLEPVRGLDAPALLEETPSEWSDAISRVPGGTDYQALRAQLATMRESHIRARDEVRVRLNRLAELRERTTASRRRIAEGKLSRKRAPS